MSWSQYLRGSDPRPPRNDQEAKAILPDEPNAVAVYEAYRSDGESPAQATIRACRVYGWATGRDE